MFSFIVKRLAQSLLVMLIVGFIAFSMFAFVGDPISSLAGQDTGLEQREALKERLGLNDPFFVQYLNYMLGAVQGDFKISYQFKKPVQDLLAERVPATLELALFSAVLAILMGVPLGIYTALTRKRRLSLRRPLASLNVLLSRVVMTFSLIGVSLPTFLIGIALIYFFAVHRVPVPFVWEVPGQEGTQWAASPPTPEATSYALSMPAFGRGDTVDVCLLGTCFWRTGLATWDGWAHIIMPALTLALFQMTLIMRLVRAQMLEVLRTDFIKFARARGLPSRWVHYRHALKNTLVPVITIIGLQVGAIVAFSIITEQVFRWPGMGEAFIAAVLFPDFPVMAAYLMFISLIFVVINLVVDLLYFAVDPRLRDQKG